MTEKTVEELRKPVEDPIRNGEMRDEHPSYGMVHLSNVSCSGKGMPLFGSSIRHDSFVELQIGRADRTRDKYTDHYYEHTPLISIHLSPSQFTSLLTRTNTSGVPCTINFLKEEGYIEQAPHHSVQKELFNDVKEKYTEIFKTVHSLKNSVATSFKSGPVNKSQKDEISFLVTKLHNDLSSNLDFLMKCHIEKLEKIGTEMVAEAEAKVSNLLKEIGLNQLGRTEIENRGKPKLIRK